MDYQVDVATLHSDKCCYWDNEEFCDCGAIDYEKLKQCEAKLAEVEQEREEAINLASQRDAIGLALSFKVDSLEITLANRVQERDELRAERDRLYSDGCKGSDEGCELCQPLTDMLTRAKAAEQDRDRLAVECSSLRDTAELFRATAENYAAKITSLRDQLTSAQQSAQEQYRKGMESCLDIISAQQSATTRHTCEDSYGICHACRNDMLTEVEIRIHARLSKEEGK